MHVRGLVPGSFGGFQGPAETARFNAFSKSVLDTQGAVWCCRWAQAGLAAACLESPWHSQNQYSAVLLPLQQTVL